MIIATPGRLLAHIQLEKPDFSNVKFFVLDEADRMLDMGFYDDILSINKLLPDCCQKIMFFCNNARQDKASCWRNIEKSGRN